VKEKEMANTLTQARKQIRQKSTGVGTATRKPVPASLNRLLARMARFKDEAERIHEAVSEAKAVLLSEGDMDAAELRKFLRQLKTIEPTVEMLLVAHHGGEFPQLTGHTSEPSIPPEMPKPDQHGHSPARQTLRALIAREIADRRSKAGFTQAQLAELAGVRTETISRLESGKHAPNVQTVDKIDTALTAAGV
jgi:DNA-binding XRE family transcriptional regulator